MNKNNAAKIFLKKFYSDPENTLLNYGERLQLWDFVMDYLLRNGKITNTQHRKWTHE